MIFYIHGFNSGRDSATGKLLQKQMDRPVKCLEYDCSKPFRENLDRLGTEAWPEMDGFDVLVGCSLGGLYACELAKELQTCAVVFNPTMRPKSQLRQFIGENVNFATGKKWLFTEDVLDTYPEELKPPKGLPVKCVASKEDELLPGNALLAKKAFSLSEFEFIESGHVITDFSKYIGIIKAYENFLGVCPFDE